MSGGVWSLDFGGSGAMVASFFSFFLFPKWLVVVVCLYLEAGGCLHFQRSNLAKHLKMFSMKI